MSNNKSVKLLKYIIIVLVILVCLIVGLIVVKKSNSNTSDKDNSKLNSNSDSSSEANIISSSNEDIPDFGDSEKEFSFSFKDTKAIKLNKILDYNDYDSIDDNKIKYNVYTLGGDASIIINEKSYDLKKILDKNTINVYDIISQAETDRFAGNCKSDMYKDGGSREYFYDDFTLLVTSRIALSSSEPQDIVFLRKGYTLNSFDEIRKNNYDGPDYSEGIGKQYIVKEVINDNMLFVYIEGNNYTYYFVDTNNLDFDAKNCKYGDKLNIIYSGTNELVEDSIITEYKGFNRDTYEDVPVKLNISDNSKSGFEIIEIISDKLWIVSPKSSEHKEYLIIGNDDVIDGEPKVGSFVDGSAINENEMVSNSLGGAIYNLKDITEIEKAK